jgi:predicted ATPase
MSTLPSRSADTSAGTLNRGSAILRSICPTNVLSFSTKFTALELQSLNVFVGPNGSGKSNFVELLALLRAMATSIRDVVAEGGGANEWIWKGAPKRSATLDVVWAMPHRKDLLRHVFSFKAAQQGFSIEDERIENGRPKPGQEKPYFYYRFQHGRPMINVSGGRQRQLAKESIDIDRSILAQRRDPESYPEITSLVDLYERIRVYREWSFGRRSVLRQPQRADLRTDRLEEDFSNLGLFLNKLRRSPQAKAEILNGLRDLYEGLTDFDVSVEGGTVQVFLTEGNFVIPATRLSDGTVRYLCLLAILCDPDPPPLIALEEPELGLHPDMLPKVADMLIAAAHRTQIVVTTHSDILVDALTKTPQAVVIVEKHHGETSMSRLNEDELSKWLGQYRLGQLWTRGELGGTRW